MFGRGWSQDCRSTDDTHFPRIDGDRPVGAAICFIGFSTFAAKLLINIHDFVVLPASRGKGVGRRLLDAVEGKARELGCCKLTLEVMDNNHHALRMYQAAGFVRYALQKKRRHGNFHVEAAGLTRNRNMNRLVSLALVKALLSLTIMVYSAGSAWSEPVPGSLPAQVEHRC